jgi:hypothetical protein
LFLKIFSLSEAGLSPWLYLVSAILLEEVSKPAMKRRRALEMRIDSISSELKIFAGHLASIVASNSNWLSTSVSVSAF